MLKWFVLLLEVIENNEDALVKFMHSHLSSTFFNWPSKYDCCWVPKPHILIMLKALSFSTTSHKYQIDSDDF